MHGIMVRGTLRNALFDWIHILRQLWLDEFPTFLRADGTGTLWLILVGSVHS